MDTKHEELNKSITKTKLELTTVIEQKEKSFQNQITMLTSLIDNNQKISEQNAEDRMQQLLQAITLRQAPSAVELTCSRHGVGP